MCLGQAPTLLRMLLPTRLALGKGGKTVIEPSNNLVAVSAKRGLDGSFHTSMNRRGSAKIAATLLGQPRSQVAGAGAAVHGFARGRQAKTLFRGLVGLHLGLGFCFSHDKTRSQSAKRAIKVTLPKRQTGKLLQFTSEMPQRHPPPTKLSRQRVTNYIGRLQKAKEHRRDQITRITHKLDVFDSAAGGMGALRHAFRPSRLRSQPLRPTVSTPVAVGQ